MNAWLPQASYPCGNFSDTSCVKFRQTKGSQGHGFPVRTRTEKPNQVSIYPYVPHEISGLIELTLGHLCYPLTDVPPQPNSQPDTVFGQGRRTQKGTTCHKKRQPRRPPIPIHQISKTTSRVVVFHGRQPRWENSHLFYTSRVILQCQTRVKLNRVFFPR